MEIITISNSKTTMRTSDLRKELADESKREELLKGILDHQVVALSFDDIQSLLSDYGIVIRSIGGGDTCQAALDNVMSAPQLQECDIFNANKVLITVSVRHLDSMVEDTDTLRSFFDKFNVDYTMLRWGLSCHPEQSQEFIVNLWVVTTDDKRL